MASWRSLRDQAARDLRKRILGRIAASPGITDQELAAELKKSRPHIALLVNQMRGEDAVRRRAVLQLANGRLNARQIGRRLGIKPERVVADVESLRLNDPRMVGQYLRSLDIKVEDLASPKFDGMWAKLRETKPGDMPLKEGRKPDYPEMVDALRDGVAKGVFRDRNDVVTALTKAGFSEEHADNALSRIPKELLLGLPAKERGRILLVINAVSPFEREMVRVLGAVERFPNWDVKLLARRTKIPPYKVASIIELLKKRKLAPEGLGLPMGAKSPPRRERKEHEGMLNEAVALVREVGNAGDMALEQALRSKHKGIRRTTAYGVIQRAKAEVGRQKRLEEEAFGLMLQTGFREGDMAVEEKLRAMHPGISVLDALRAVQGAKIEIGKRKKLEKKPAWRSMPEEE